MTTLIVGILVVSLSVLLALAGLALVQRLIPASHRESHNTVAGIIYMPLSGLFGVLAAFAVFLVWQQFDVAYRTTQSEASELTEIYEHANEFPEPERQQVRESARSYAQIVIDEEWSLMGQGQESPQAEAIAAKLRESVDGFEPSTLTEQTLYGREVTLVDDMMKDRRLRLLQSREGIPTILWVVLLTGAPLLVGFTYLFGLKSYWAHLLMVAMLTAAIVTVLFTIKSLEYPFTGDTRVTPSAFELVQSKFEVESK